MPTDRIAMRRLREMLRLTLDAGLPLSETARRLGIARSSLREMVQRVERSGLPWPLPMDRSDADLEARLYGEAGTKQVRRRRAEPDWAALNRELKKKHVTLQIRWDEYIETHPDRYRYSRFCELYRGWEASLPVTMRQIHLGGDKLFVDCAGDTVPVIVDLRTGTVRRAHIFVAVMGRSSLSFAHASWTETLPDWIDAHVQAFTYFGGESPSTGPPSPRPMTTITAVTRCAAASSRPSARARAGTTLRAWWPSPASSPGAPWETRPPTRSEPTPCPSA
jgi:transposase-like protein